jgi:hypothetical protein
MRSLGASIGPGWALAIATLFSLSAGAQSNARKLPEPTEQHEFFESRIRPVLIENCYVCHNSAETAEGGLAVDFKGGLLRGGDRGAVLVPGDPRKSRLLATLRHEIEDLKMPQGGPKLEPRVIADFEKWIADGAFDPRDQPPTAEELEEATAWATTLERRKEWWSFQPIKPHPVPQLNGDRRNGHPIDDFVQAKLDEAGLSAADAAEPAALVRRLYFNLIGLPPSSEEATDWTERISQAAPDARQAAIGQLVDELLSSERFGERWARHWMDWIRYAESHGSEGDPEISGAWQYRDYLIRALNADIPVDQLIREHVAGDLLREPRVNRELGINESAIGPAHWRMVFHGFAPTDALDEKVRFIDDQINSFSKAFLGLTISCARCHDHKFDAISQQDYYALFGVLGSCRPGRKVIDLPERVNLHRDRLAALKPQIRDAVAQDWLGGLDELRSAIAAEDGPAQRADKAGAVLNLLFNLRQAVAAGRKFTDEWQRYASGFTQQASQQPGAFEFRSRLGDAADYAAWFASGPGLANGPSIAGEFSIEAAGDRVLSGIYPAGVYSHGLSTKHGARLASRDINLGGDLDLWVRVIGGGGATVRYAVQDYPRSGTVYPVTGLSGDWKWQRYDLTYWSGDDVHIELATAADAPLLVKDQPRSWFGVREAVLRRRDQPAPVESAEHLEPLFAAGSRKAPKSVDDLASLYGDVIEAAITAWQADLATDGQALLLDECLRQGLLPNQLAKLARAAPLVADYRRLEDAIPVPTRVPGLDESVGQNQRLFERGNHKQPGSPVPRRFLEAIDSASYRTEQSGRLELAADLLRPDNPLTRRVLVNRVWHHLFGRGLVSTPDNFGRLGDVPSHPELLDWLALRFEEDGWSLRKLIRLIVTSNSWQRTSRTSAEAREQDPENRLLSHANVRRLEAEAVRDVLLTVSGRIQHQAGGPPVDGGAPRRSVYVRVRRNSLDPFLRAFDFPEPSATVGRRDVTNVPAQSLTMLNDRQVAGYATAWARRVLALPVDAEPEASRRARVQEIFRTAFGRAATNVEVDRSLQYLAATRQRFEEQQQRVASLRREAAERRRRIDALKSPVRERLLEARRGDGAKAVEFVPEPIGRWEFEDSADDVIGEADGKLQGGAKLDGGALVVRDGGHVVTRPIKTTVREKTLEAWVQLDNLDQRAGGVITIQSPDGVFFDSIVFAERDPRQWLAGSNNFARTQPFNGVREEEAAGQPVHVAIVYQADGMVIGYRNGKRYGSAYRSSGPYEFKAGQAVLSFGVRHLPAAGNRFLSGKILRAQLYDRALSAEEVAASSGASSDYVPDSRVMAELSTDERAAVSRLNAEIESLEADLKQSGNIPEEINEVVVWSELARAIFTFKEFIYVR